VTIGYGFLPTITSDIAGILTIKNLIKVKTMLIKNKK
jgi:hypothetical protein